jgi:type II secretory ATPase GspE/PulE/Tfp pilus assembly ATPase PilB-like protein
MTRLSRFTHVVQGVPRQNTVRRLIKVCKNKTGNRDARKGMVYGQEVAAEEPLRRGRECEVCGGLSHHVHRLRHMERVVDTQINDICKTRQKKSHEKSCNTEEKDVVMILERGNPERMARRGRFSHIVQGFPEHKTVERFMKLVQNMTMNGR